MGCVESAAFAVDACAQIPSLNKGEIRPPWALAQADKFEWDDCPFCDLRRHHCMWLRSEIKRLKSEVSAVQTTIPPRLFPELRQQLEAGPLPPSGYTGGVDDISASSCPRCPEFRCEVSNLQEEARKWDAECKARIEFRRGLAGRIENMLIEKRQIEAKIFATGTGTVPDDGQFFAITRVNLADEDLPAAAAARPL
mmetsp:Transcript_30043/g.69434  ORF Transcript_30043/g.69434 Transcript_30043/m.69434 type:complete len:196 (+) Transcript_30043:80-667(+)